MNGLTYMGDLVADCSNDVIILNQPISFWSGIQPTEGRVIDDSQLCFGESLRNKVLITNGVKGSTAAPGVILELLGSDNAPKGIISHTFQPEIFAGISMARIVTGDAPSKWPFYIFLDVLEIAHSFDTATIIDDQLYLT